MLDFSYYYFILQILRLNSGNKNKKQKSYPGPNMAYGEKFYGQRLN